MNEPVIQGAGAIIEDADARAGFITRTYTHLFGAFLLLVQAPFLLYFSRSQKYPVRIGGVALAAIMAAVISSLGIVCTSSPPLIMGTPTELNRVVSRPRWWRFTM